MRNTDTTTEHRAFAYEMYQEFGPDYLWAGLDRSTFDGLEALAAFAATECYGDPHKYVVRSGVETGALREFARSRHRAVKINPATVATMATRSDFDDIRLAVAEALGEDVWDLPYVDSPPEWLRGLGSFEDDGPRLRAAVGWWLQQSGQQMMLNAATGDAGRSFRQLSDLDTVEQATPEVDDMPIFGRDMPFFSEAVLYPLVGKEQARSVTALMRQLGRSLGSGR